MKYIYLSLAFLLFVFSCNEKSREPEPPSNVVYVVCTGSKSVEVIDLKSYQRIKQFSLSTQKARYPRGISLSEDKSLIAVANPAYNFELGHWGLHGKEYPGGVLVLKTSTGKIVSDFDTPQANYNTAFSTDGKEIWTTAVSHSGRAHAFDIRGNLKSEVKLDADPSQIIVTADGQYAAACSEESTYLQLIDIKTKELVKKIKVDLAPTNVWPGVDNTLLVSNKYKRSVNFVDLTVFKVTDFIDLDFEPEALAFNTITKELWICDAADSTIRIFKRGGTKWQQTDTIKLDGTLTNISFCKGYSMALIAAKSTNKLFFINALSKEKITETAVGESPSGLVIAE